MRKFVLSAALCQAMIRAFEKYQKTKEKKIFALIESISQWSNTAGKKKKKVVNKQSNSLFEDNKCCGRKNRVG